MIRNHLRSSNSTSDDRSSASNNRGDKSYVVVDVTDLTRKFINQVDYEVCDLGYDLAGILTDYDSIKSPPTTDPGQLAKKAMELCDKGRVKDFEDALIVADYVVNSFYPAIARYTKHLGYVGAKVVEGTVSLTGANRKIYCNVIMMVV